jgi:flagellar biosynthesis/type III secretory pathway chaperone
MALIVISGGGNFFATQKSSSEREHQIDRAIQQVHDLHATLDETERRQRKALDNQTQILEHDTKLLQEVHEITVKLEQMRHVDQMRGAPP